MDPLRDYLRLAFDYSADGKIHAASVAWSNMTDDDRSVVLALLNRIDDHATKNAGLLADLTDAIYGKGTAETRGYPRGMVAKARRVFNRLRRMRKGAAPLYFLSDNLSDNEAALIAEVK